jgi:putative hydrolase of the HAD superfamily
MYAVPPRPRAVVFDFFGTLTSACTRGPRHAAIARKLGCDPAPFSAELDRTFYQRAAGRYGPPIEALRRMARAAGGRPGYPQLVEAAVDRVEAIRADIVMRPEAVSVLRDLSRRGIPTVLVSDCWYELPHILPDLPIAPLLIGTVFSIDVGQCKPHPAMYLEACRRLRADPDECLYIGDGGSRELSGARDVGMLAVRLAAPDLAGHLAWHRDTDWSGPAVATLADAVAFIDRDAAGAGTGGGPVTGARRREAVPA